jgi:hypothetical protein
VAQNDALDMEKIVVRKSLTFSAIFRPKISGNGK